MALVKPSLAMQVLHLTPWGGIQLLEPSSKLLLRWIAASENLHMAGDDVYSRELGLPAQCMCQAVRPALFPVLWVPSALLGTFQSLQGSRLAHMTEPADMDSTPNKAVPQRDLLDAQLMSFSIWVAKAVYYTDKLETLIFKLKSAQYFLDMHHPPKQAAKTQCIRLTLFKASSVLRLDAKASSNLPPARYPSRMMPALASRLTILKPCTCMHWERYGLTSKGNFDISCFCLQVLSLSNTSHDD